MSDDLQWSCRRLPPDVLLPAMGHRRPENLRGDSESRGRRAKDSEDSADSRSSGSPARRAGTLLQGWLIR